MGGCGEAGGGGRIALPRGRRCRGGEDAPPIAETLPGFRFEGWFAVVARARTPPEIVTRLNQEIRAFQREAEAAKRLSGFGCIPDADATPETTAEFLAGERERWGKIVQELGVEPQ